MCLCRPWVGVSHGGAYLRSALGSGRCVDVADLRGPSRADEISPTSAGFGPVLTAVAPRLWPSLARVVRNSGGSGQSRLDLAKAGRIYAEVDQSRPKLSRFEPKLARCLSKLATVCPILVSGRSLASVARLLSNAAELGLKIGQQPSKPCQVLAAGVGAAGERHVVGTRASRDRVKMAWQRSVVTPRHVPKARPPAMGRPQSRPQARSARCAVWPRGPRPPSGRGAAAPPLPRLASPADRRGSQRPAAAHRVAPRDKHVRVLLALCAPALQMLCMLSARSDRYA